MRYDHEMTGGHGRCRMAGRRTWRGWGGIRTLLALLAVPAALCLPGNRLAGTHAASVTARARITPSIAGIPLSFEINRGQAPAGTAFIAHSGAYTAALSATGVS